MAGLDDLFAEIPVQDIANKIGADEGEVNNAIRTLVPALVGVHHLLGADLDERTSLLRDALSSIESATDKSTQDNRVRILAALSAAPPRAAPCGDPHCPGRRRR